MFKAAWELTRQPPGDSLDDAKRVFRSWDADKRSCHEFYGFLLCDIRPPPDSVQYISMGYCACTSFFEEWALHLTYRDLITKCTFERFHRAYITHSLLPLMKSKGLAGHLPQHFASATGLLRPAVWDLKSYALYDNIQEPVVEPHPVLVAEYGFKNAKSKEDADVLKKAYQLYFESKDADAAALHNACLEKKIYEHVDSVIRLKSKRLRCLMAND
ncbi:hypothetical protein PUNSTDRAFT_69050 [Punctularia strigosozonata HHB-11173 SS5]|uniref:uncharacterized protein n=1 Tax=Punctularia strigosozonata (strain HHB-11173) TaxID=741275 RepID=UPI0004418590|nr:uncharacterized protein PUNSTDRAFT_69050 [Punctularia strigosozonata HHB-11173 SS5]EIN08415.1 hypothetical protein PUNSTDRAFT_69050 [Punctularia strigosozonata HHB-11173 SS5]